MKKGHRLIFFLIGLAGMALLVIRLDPEENHFRDVLHPNTLLFLAGMLLLWVFIYAIHTQAYYRIIDPKNKEIRWITIYRIVVSGFALNNLTPFGLAGGEPYRIMELRPYIGTRRAASATLSFTLVFIIGHVLMWITGIAVYVILGCPGETWITVLLLITAAVFIGITMIFFLKRKGGIVMPLMRLGLRIPWLKKHTQKFLDKTEEHLREIDESYIAFKSHPRNFAMVVLTEYGARIAESLEYFLIYLYIGQKVNFLGGILILSMASLIGNLFFMIPMQAGTREGGMVMALRWLGIDPTVGVPGGLLYRVRDILLNLIGIVCILIEKKHEEKFPPGEAEEPALEECEPKTDKEDKAV